MEDTVWGWNGSWRGCVDDIQFGIAVCILDLQDDALLRRSRRSKRLNGFKKWIYHLVYFIYILCYRCSSYHSTKQDKNPDSGPDPDPGGTSSPAH